MPHLRTLQLSEAAQESLEEMSKHHPKAYLRERAAALLKIERGRRPAEVARTGLLRCRKPDTVYTWLDRYEQFGLRGLYVRAGRGRKLGRSP